MRKCQYCDDLITLRSVGTKTVPVDANGRLHVCLNHRVQEKRHRQRKKKKSVCKKCGLELGWKKLPNGKWCPTNPDGSDHWDLCRETQRKGQPVQEELVGIFTYPTDKNAVMFDEDYPPWFESEREFLESL